jgi:hypothetical protein
VTRLEDAPGLELTLEVSHSGEEGDSVVSVELTAKNTSGDTLEGVIVEARVPDGLNSFKQSITDGGGNCTSSGGNVLCDRGEFIQWDLGTLVADESRSVGVSPDLDSTEGGQLLPMVAVAYDDRTTRAVDRDVIPMPMLIPEPGLTLQLGAAIVTLIGMARRRRRI